VGVFDWLRRRPTSGDSSADLTKAASPVQATFTPADTIRLASAVVAAATGNPTVTPSTPLPRNPADLVPFGPGHPLYPQPIDPANPRTGRAEPRLSEYPVSINLPGVTDRLIPWKVLRDAADAIGLFRRCIEVRKAEIIGLEWDVTISKDAVSMALRSQPGASKVDVERQLRERYEGEIGRLRAFWQNPDRGNDYTLVEWLMQLLEEHFVLDAIAIYPRRTYSGDVWSLEVLDGSTIKPLLDSRGGRPLPPHPAYQQILQGFPRGEFVASTVVDELTGRTVIPSAFPADQLFYKRRTVRTFSPYGLSAVEQALYDGEVWLRRVQWIKSEYTEGALPPSRLKNVNGDSEFWTPTQISLYEQALNDLLAGDTAARKKVRLNPPGWEIDGQPSDVAEKYRPEYDLFLIKLVGGHFETTATELGFPETGGLGATGFHEGQADLQDRKATHPTLTWLQGLLTQIQRRVLAAPPELEFKFLGLDSEDEAAADAVAESRVKTGRMTLNQEMDRLGLPRYDFDEADMPMLMTGRGVVFLDGASKLAEAGEEIGPAQASPEEDDADVAAAATPTAGGPAKKAARVQKTDELRALRVFLTKGDRGRPFHADHLTAVDVTAAGLDVTRVLFKADGADAGGRDDRRGSGVERVRPLRQADRDQRRTGYHPGVDIYH
jgi:hypothetical protein